MIILDELDTHKAFRPRKTDDNNTVSTTSSYDIIDTNSDSEENIFECNDNYGPVRKTLKNNLKNRVKKICDKLTLGAFLESMDGISSTTERVVIGMTNHPNLLDPAIIRPGRFDLVINMDSLDEKYMQMYLKYIFDGFNNIEDSEIIEACIYASKNKISTSMIEQACIEKYSTGNLKSLYECIKTVRDSFILGEIETTNKLSINQ